MNRLLSIDPGIRGCGVAVFENAILKEAAYIKNPAAAGNLTHEAATMAKEVVLWARLSGTIDELAVEWPRVYATQIRMGKSKADPNDLLPLAGVVTGVAVGLSPARARTYVPSDWKAQMKDEPTRHRTKTRLDKGELHTAEAAAKIAGYLEHNLWDGVGIGLHHLGRFTRKRVIAS